ncbi:acetolactate synthase small subunit [Clostridia bacterium]|nr:acetolactate synthase small subunit [Clostridia bacterium]
MKHTLSILVENKPSVLSRIVGLFSRRGFDIKSLAVGETENPRVSRVTITVGDDDNTENPDFVRTLEQIKKQLHKLIDIIRVKDFNGYESLSRELILVKVGYDTEDRRSNLISIAEATKAKISDITESTITLELSGNKNKVRTFERLLKPYGIKELVRTGEIALQRGNTSLNA